MPYSNPIVGGTALIRRAINSPNFVTGVSGWSINADGTVEVNSGVFRGSIVVGPTAGPNFQVTASVPAVVSTFYHATYSGSVLAAFDVLLLVDANNYYYEVLLTTSVFGPAVGRGWVIAGVVVEESFSYVDTGQVNLLLRSVVLTIGDSLLSTSPNMFFGAVSLPRGLQLFERIASTINSPTDGLEHTMYTTAAYTFQNNRAYKLVLSGLVSCPTVAARPRFRVREGTGVAGTQLVQPATTLIDVASTDVPVYIEQVFVNTAGHTITTTMTVTWQAANTVSVRWDGAATAANAYFEVVDIGDASVYNGISLT